MFVIAFRTHYSADHVGNWWFVAAYDNAEPGFAEAARRDVAVTLGQKAQVICFKWEWKS